MQKLSRVLKKVIFSEPLRDVNLVCPVIINNGLLIQTVYSSWTPANRLLLDTQQPEVKVPCPGASRQQQVETEFVLIDMERKMCRFTTRKAKHAAGGRRLGDRHLCDFMKMQD